jgi:8-oxo-dGTP pyrophosphatase MutT (NUDIX family)
MTIIEIIRDSLNNREPKTIDNPDSRYIHSSVLIPIFSEDDQYMVLFTERTNRVEHHKGQISFPGGAVDEYDGSLEETALREAYEEIGLLKGDVELLGRTDDMLTLVSGFIVHPFVGRIPFPYPFKINPREVDSIVFIPLCVFMDKTSGHITDSVDVEGFTYHGTSYEYQGHAIWGATARIMENFIRILGANLCLPGKSE